MKLAHIDDNNKILGWYDSEIHSSIPSKTIEVSEEQWKNSINNNHNKINSDGTTETFDFRTDEQKALDIREERNWLLKESDWTQGADVPQTTKDTWSTYRQSLRDVPQQETFPTSVTFPTKPN